LTSISVTSADDMEIADLEAIIDPTKLSFLEIENADSLKSGGDLELLLPKLTVLSTLSL